ncbi:MAG: hypothetical protein SFU56_21530 [Capsulimonadales bacterium]|nr:hypothetical protein [Capsulimonadales bacterium]
MYAFFLPNLAVLAFLFVHGSQPAVVRQRAPEKTKMTYPQLISTRYPKGAAAPVTSPPVPAFEFVDRSLLPPNAQVKSAARIGNDIVWALTDQGWFRKENGRFVRFDLPQTFKPHQSPVHGDTQLVELATDGKGHLWAATTHGLLATDGKLWWQPIDHRDGMPYISMTCLHLAANGDVWGGTEEGAWRLRDGHFRYFFGKRWLPGNRVERIWSDSSGRIWLLTDGGTACIEEKPMTLAEKAAHIERITARHNRRGYVTGCTLTEPGNPDRGVRFHASDNDGLWTAIYIAAESYRYAATKDPEARALARKSMDALLDLERLTGIPGFPARAVMTDEEIRAGVEGFDPDETVRVDGEKTKIWFRSPVEKNVWCKGDTSSDEMDGHYFAWYVYHELVADAAEKKRIAEVVRRVTNYILDHDLTLVGHHGSKTRWGVWAPKYLNDDPRWYEERGLNSVEILCFLKVASHICGDKRFEDAFNDLVDNHHYLLNTLVHRRHTPWYAINHSDDELAWVTYFPLLRLEKDPARRRLLTESVARNWEESEQEQTIRQEKSPFYNFMYGAMTGRPCAVEEAVTTLEDWPWELINWTVRNSHRHDVTQRISPMNRNRNEITRVLPASERRVMKWNGNPFAPDQGGEGRTEEDGAAFLLPYWLGVYHGYISREQ